MINYQTSRGVKASEIIMSLSPDSTWQAAHIMTVFDLCLKGMAYSNQDGDVLTSAQNAIGKWGIPAHAAAFAEFQNSRRVEMQVAIKWAISA